MEEREILNSCVPDWVDEKKKINEVLFCTEFLRDHPIISINDAFFTVNGRVFDENQLRKTMNNANLYCLLALSD